MRHTLEKLLELLGFCALLAGTGLVILFPPALGRLLALGKGQDPAARTLACCPGKSHFWWDNIGGCGVGGASGGSGGGAKWVGRGATGGLVNLEIMQSSTWGGDYTYRNANMRVSHEFLNRNTIGASLPFSTKTGTYKYNPSDAPNTQSVGGVGDLGIDYTRLFGHTNAGSFSAALVLPTGKYDHRRYDRNYENEKSAEELGFLVTPELQTGTGVYSGSITAEYTIDKDWGPIIVGASYTAMLSSLLDIFNFKRKRGAQNDVWSRENIAKNKDFARFGGLVDTIAHNRWYNLPTQQPYPEDYNTFDLNGNPVFDTVSWVHDSTAWETTGKHYQDSVVYVTNTYHTRGEDGARKDPLNGDFFGDAIGLNVAAGLMQESFVHSLSLNYSYKLQQDWFVRREDPNYAQFWEKDTTGRRRDLYLLPVYRDTKHTFSASYGLEFSSEWFPVFLAGTVTFSPREIQSCSGTIGVRGSFF